MHEIRKFVIEKDPSYDYKFHVPIRKNEKILAIINEIDGVKFAKWDGDYLICIDIP